MVIVHINEAYEWPTCLCHFLFVFALGELTLLFTMHNNDDIDLGFNIGGDGENNVVEEQLLYEVERLMNRRSINAQVTHLFILYYINLYIISYQI